MFASDPVLVDPEPQAGRRDLAGLDWEDSWDCTATTTTDSDWEPADDVDLDAELRSLLDSEDPALAGVLAQLAERTEAALTAESTACTSDLSGWSDAAIVSEAARLERLTRWATARGYELVQELASRRPDPSGSPDERGLSAYAVDEIAVATGITRWAACKRVAEADALTHRHPQLLLALSAGCLTQGAVTRVLETTAVLDPDHCAVVEARLLDRAGRPVLHGLGTATPADLEDLTTEQAMGISAKATPGYVGKVARDLAHRLDPAAAKRREAKAKAGRSVRLEPGADGMSWLIAHLPTAAALAGYEHLDSLAHTLPDDHEGPADDRSIDAKRADVLTSLLLGATLTPDGALTPPAPIHLHVIVDGRQATTSDHVDRRGAGMPGQAGRVGPVTADTIRHLLDLTEHTAGLVDGAIAVEQPCPGPDVHHAQGPGPYAPPEKLKNLLRVRHRTCVFPGCTRPARNCELDHTQRYPDGPTCECNLAPLCVHHHHLKHHAPGWTLVNHGHGHLTWTTPTGRTIHIGGDDLDDIDDRDTAQGPAPPPARDPDPPPDDTPPF